MKNKHDSFLGECAEILNNLRKKGHRNLLRRLILRRLVDIKRRCYNENCSDFKEYGARGIGVCDEWRNSSFDFLKWFCEQLAKNAIYYESVEVALKHLSIDRINPVKNYSPQNCRLIEKKLNDYTTNQPSRCLKFNDEWIPFWYAERLVGWERKNDDAQKMSNYVFRALKNGAKQTPYMLTLQGITSKNLGIFQNVKTSDEVVNAILEKSNGFIFYDFTENPLIIDKKSKKCPCRCGNLIFFKIVRDGKKKEIFAFCSRCGFQNLIISSCHFLSENKIQTIKNLPYKLFNRNIFSKILNKKQSEKMAEQNKKCQFRAKIDAEFKSKKTILQRKKTQDYINRKRVKMGLKPREVQPFKKTPILELQTRKAIRERLKRENIPQDSELYKQARARMVELLRAEKARRRELNPAAYYGALKRFNDKYTRKLKGADYEIKGKENALYNIHKNTPRGEIKKRQRDIVYLSEFQGKSTSELLTDADFKQGFKVSRVSDFFDKDFKSDERLKMINAFKKEVKRLSNVAK